MFDIFAQISIGWANAVSPINLFFCLIGVLLGTVVGVLPGIGPLVSISLLFPITLHLEPVSALIMLAGIYYGASYGGSTTSILLNLPGESASAITCLDGYPMAKQGRPGVALLITAITSFIGGSIGIVLLMMFAPAIASIGLRFGPAENFSLMLMALIAASVVGSGSSLKGVAMVIFGVTLGLVGTDPQTGVQRFVFGVPEFYEGLSLVALAMGLFGIPEIISSIRETRNTSVERQTVTLRSMIPTRKDLSQTWRPALRGSAIGSFFGVLPGTGGLIASFMSYSLEKRIARDPSRFGNGAIEGISGPEAANNAAAQTSFIPTLTLGIPGSATMAIMLSLLIVHGISPGPRMINEHPDVFWGLVMSFWIGNVLLLILNIPLIGIWVRLLTIPYNLLYPAILMFICIGAYSASKMPLEVGMVVGFGALGYLLRLLSFPAVPVILGFVLGPMIETQFVRSMLLSRGDFMTFVERPISASILAVAAAILIWAGYSALSGKGKPIIEEEE